MHVWPAPRAEASVVVLHGWGEHAGLYDGLAEALNARGLSVYALDAEGYGASEGERGVLSDLDGWLEDVEATVSLAEAAGGPVSLLGHDIGGLAAALVAARDPGRYRALVLASARVSSAGLRGFCEMFTEAQRPAARIDPRLLTSDQAFLARLAADPAVWAGGISMTTVATIEAGCERVRGLAPRIEVPVLVMRGELDQLLPAGTLEQWAFDLPDRRYWRVPRSRNSVFNDHARDRVRDEVASFLLHPTGTEQRRPAADGPRAAERPPDIVLIMTDQQRWDWLGHTSDGHFETPNIDRLAEAGVTFERAYSSATVCVPARTALLTGRQHIHAELQPDGRAIRPGVWTIARELRARGYQTALVGRMHFEPIHADHGFETMRMCENINPGSGYDEAEGDDYRRWLAERGEPDWRLVHRYEDGSLDVYNPDDPRVFPAPAEHHSTGWIEREAVEVLRNRSDDRPLFLVVSFPHPHSPYDPPEPYASMYPPEESRPPADGFDLDRVLPESYRSHLDDPWVKRVPPGKAGEHHVRRVLASIRALVRHIDDAVGRIVEEIDLPSSLVFFTADHGDYGGHRGLLAKSPWVPFDHLIRVPLVVSGGVVAGEAHRSQAPVQNSSFVPTVLDYLGIEVPWESFEFPSLRAYLDGDRSSIEPDRSLVAFSYPMVRQGRYKLIADGDLEHPMLFDLEADPDETVSLADDPAYQDLVRDLVALLQIERARLPAEDPTAGVPGGWCAPGRER